MKRSWIAGLLLLAVILGGSWVRLTQLGERSFRGDELRHYFVAESLERGEGPRLPAGIEYGRGLDVSRLIGVFTPRVEDQELAARLPGALFGVLNLLLFGAIAWAMGGPWAAVFATLLLAIYPEAVEQSRRVRFYTYQLNFGLIALFAGWKALERTGQRAPYERRDVRRQWAWFGVAAIAFALAGRVQIVTLTVMGAWMIAVALAGLVNARLHGWSQWRRNVPLQATVAAVVLGLIPLVARPELLGQILWAAFFVPAWVTGADSPLVYYWALTAAMPIVVALAPLAFLATARRQPALAVYLLIWFGVPFLLHSLVFPFKADRFILVAHPALFLAAGIAAADGLSALIRGIPAWLGTTWSERARRRVAVATCTIIALGAIVTLPAFNAARQIGSNLGSVMDRENWSGTTVVLAEQADLDRLKLGSSDEFTPLFYWKRLDFHTVQGGGDVGAISESTGVRRLQTPDQIRHWFSDGAAVVVAVDSARLAYGAINQALHSVLREEGTELCRGRCGSLLLYRWEFGPLEGEHTSGGL